MKKLILYLIITANIITGLNAQCSQLDAGPDVTVDCNNNCTTLSAIVFPGIGAQTDTYAINADTPCPLPPSGTINQTYLNIDDRWTNVITLPFTFYYFGQPYNYVIISSNGVISFETNRNSPPIQAPNQYSAWQFDTSLPSPDLFRNAIFGAYHDLDPSVTPNTITYYVSGEYPQRKFVFTFDNVAHFSCNNLHTTQRIVLYETSNVIDVQIDQKDLCSSWNNGNAVVGIQNQDGTVAYVPTGRNTGAWTVPDTAPELWRFVPNHNPSTIVFDYKWYNDATNTLVGSGQSINVCVTEDTVFRVEASYNDPNTGQQYTLTDTVTVFFDNQLGTPDLGPDINECDNPTVTLDGTTANATSYEWEKDGVVLPGVTTPTLTVSDSGTYTVTANYGICSASDEVVVHIEPRPIVSLGPDIVECDGNVVTLTPDIPNLSGNEVYQWQKDGDDIPGASNPTLDVTESGLYTLIVTNTIGCDASDDVQVTFDPIPYLNLGGDQTVCFGDTAIVKSNITDADRYEWIVNGNISGNTTDELTLNASGDYDVVLNLDRGTCSATDTIHVTVLNPINVTATPVLYGELSVEATGGLPPYEYSVNGIDYQTSNYFIELPDGDYNISIRDANACEYNDILNVHVTNLINMQFFTPNGDGYNDYWRIINSENTPEASLYIYDRYGKLIKQMHTQIHEVWDGSFKGTPLVSNDYWYMLVLPSGKIYKGHFTLKR